MPTVTSLEKIKRLKGWYTLIFDKVPSFPVNDELILKYRIKAGEKFLPRELKEIREKGEYLFLKRKSLEILSRRRLSEKEIREKLKRVSKSTGHIDRLIDELKELKFVDDIEYAKALIHTLGVTGKKSIRYIRDKLYQKGIPKEIIDQTTESELREYDETAIALNLAARKYATLKKLPTLKAKKRVADFLKSKGFSWDDINYALDSVFTEDD